jgi:hypothetical protein
LNGYTSEFHREFMKRYEKFHKLSKKPDTEILEFILMTPFIIGFLASIYLFMGKLGAAMYYSMLFMILSFTLIFLILGAFAFKVIYGAHQFEKFLLKHFSSEKVDFLLSGKTFGKEHLSEKIRQIKENENFSDESFYNEIKIFIEGEENGK